MSIAIKRGDSLSLDCMFRDDSGTPVDLTAYTITSVIQYAAAQVASFTIVKADQSIEPGMFTMSAATGAWPLGDLSSDIKLVDGSGTVRHTDRFTISVAQPITP